MLPQACPPEYAPEAPGPAALAALWTMLRGADPLPLAQQDPAFWAELATAAKEVSLFGWVLALAVSYDFVVAV
jgi:hypothetical protein